MPKMIRRKLTYFDYSAEFDMPAFTPHDMIRAEANRLIIAAYGTAPKLSYPVPGVPFPPYVPVMHWDCGDASLNYTPGWF
jgi:hypothetical protein